MATKTSPSPVKATENTGTTVTDPRLSEITDGSAVANASLLAEAEAGIKAAGKGLLSAVRGVDKQSNIIARWRCRAMRAVVTASGNPDWSMAKPSQTLQATVEAVEESAYTGATKEEVSSLRRAVRNQAVRVGYLEAEIVDYVLSTLSADAIAALGTLKWVAGTGDIDKGGRPALLAEVPTALKKLVAAQYKSAELKVPEKFGGDPRNPAAQKDKKVAPAVVVDQAVTAIEEGGFSVLTATEGVQKLLTALYSHTLGMDADGWKGQREDIENMALKCSGIARGLALIAAGKHTVEDGEKIATMLYSKPNA